MSNTLPILLGASLFAGGAGAVATTVLLSPQGGPQAGPTTVEGGNSEVLAAIDVLREENRTIIDRVAALELSGELAPVGASRTAATAGRGEIEDIVKDILGAYAPGEGGIAATPEMQLAVESVLDMREERQRQEREQKRIEADAKRLEDRLAKLQTDLGLDQSQMNSMRTIYQDESVRRDEMRTQMRVARDSGNADMANMRQVWVDFAAATNTAIQGVLSPSQYEQYEASNQNQRFGGRGGDNGGGGRRGR